MRDTEEVDLEVMQLRSDLGSALERIEVLERAVAAIGVGLIKLIGDDKGSMFFGEVMGEIARLRMTNPNYDCPWLNPNEWKESEDLYKKDGAK